MIKIGCFIFILIVDITLLAFELKMPYKNKSVKFNVIFRGIPYLSIIVINTLGSLLLSQIFKINSDISDSPLTFIDVAIYPITFLIIYALDKYHIKKHINPYREVHKDYDEYVGKFGFGIGRAGPLDIWVSSLAVALLVMASMPFLYGCFLQ